MSDKSTSGALLDIRWACGWEDGPCCQGTCSLVTQHSNLGGSSIKADNKPWQHLIRKVSPRQKKSTSCVSSPRGQTLGWVGACGNALPRAPWTDAAGREGGKEEGRPSSGACSPSPGDRPGMKWVTHQKEAPTVLGDPVHGFIIWPRHLPAGRPLLDHGWHTWPPWRTSPVQGGGSPDPTAFSDAICGWALGYWPSVLAPRVPACLCHDYLTHLLNLAVGVCTQWNVQPPRLWVYLLWVLHGHPVLDGTAAEPCACRHHSTPDPSTPGFFCLHPQYFCLSSLPQPQPSIPSPIFKCPWVPSQFSPAWSWLMGGHWRSIRTVHPRRGGISSSGEVEGPGPLCPDAVKNTGVGLLVWSSGPASSILPCWGQIRRKGGKLVMGGWAA